MKTISVRLTYLLIVLVGSLLFLIQSANAQCGGGPQDADRWAKGAGWNPDGTVNENPGNNDIKGIIECAAAANTEAVVAPNSCYDSSIIDIPSGFCIDPSDGSLVYLDGPNEGQPIGWFNFDVRAFSGTYEFQVVNNSDEIGWAIFYSNQPTSSVGPDGLSGDWSDLSLQFCGINFNGWAQFPYLVPKLTLPTNYYLAIWDRNDDDFGFNFKARYGCGNSIPLHCMLEYEDPIVECQSDGSYKVTVTTYGINGEYYAFDDQALNSPTLPVCMTNVAEDDPVVSYQFELYYNGHVPYDITIEEKSPSTLNGCTDPINTADCVLRNISGSAPDCAIGNTDGPTSSEFLPVEEGVFCAFPGNYGQVLDACEGTVGDLVGATPSPEAISTATTGEDVWFSFTPGTPGVAIHVESADFDPIIELHDATNTVQDIEDRVDGPGEEILNIGNLKAGNTYLFAVRAKDGYIGDGEFTVCVIEFPDTRCDYEIGPFDMCDWFKADWVCSDDYIFHFTSHSTGVQYDYQMGWAYTFIKPKQVPLPFWDDAYDVTINSVYHAFDGNGDFEEIIIDNDEPCWIQIIEQPRAVLREQDRCENFGPHVLYDLVVAEPWICNASDWIWKFTRTDIPELPIIVNRGNSSRYLRLRNVPGLVFGGVYDVQVKPEFPTGIEAYYGEAFCLSIVGEAPGLMAEIPDVEIDLDEEEALRGDNVNYRATVEFNDGISLTPDIKLYPNPVIGNEFNLSIDSPEDIRELNVKIFNSLGQSIHSSIQYQSGNYQALISMPEDLIQGIYFVHVTFNNYDFTRRIVVSE